MIITVLAKFYFWLMWLVSAVLPSWDLPQGVYDSFDTSINLLLFMNYFFPMRTLMVCILSVFFVYLLKYFIKLIGSFISILRGGGNLDL